MSNPDHWSSLSSLLGAQGAEQPPATAEKKPAAQAPSPPKRPTLPPSISKPAPRRESDWSQLASQLGVAPTEPPRAASVPAQAPPSRPSQSQAPTSRQRPVPRDEPEPERRREPPRELEEFIAEEIGSEEPIDAELVETDDGPRGPAASQEERERTGPKRRRRRRGGRRSKSGRSAEEKAQVPQIDGQVAEAQPAADRSSDEAGESESVAATEDRVGRPKRRRRRGSGRNRDKARSEGAEPKTRLEPIAEQENEHHEDEHHEDEHDDEPFMDDDEQADLSGIDNDTDAGENEGLESQGDKNSHRAIPAWEEAIGYIVAVNMESRATNPKSGAPRGRGRGRGNPRGNNYRRPS